MATTTLPVNDKTLNKQTVVRILLVEDLPILQLIHETMLVQIGCQVDIASNGTEALAKVDNGYDLILLDLGLPDICGTEVASEVRVRLPEKHPPMVALTAQSERTVGEKCFASGIKKILTKPVDANILREVIKTYTGKEPVGVKKSV